MTPSNTFCSAPWMNRYINPIGEMSPCCFTTNIETEADIAGLKQSFIDGEQAPACKYCWHNEQHAMPSPRLDFNAAAGGKLSFDDDVYSTAEVNQLSINIGNYCNAECIICNGMSSSKRNNWLKHHNSKFHKIHTIQRANDNIDDLPYLNIKTLTLLGGEPTIHPSTYKILDYYINKGISKNISISLNTNASKLDPSLLDKLKLFDILSITLSIDGTGSYFEYQRRPIKWKIAKQVAEQWMTAADNIVINYVVTAVSIWGFNEFLTWFSTLPQYVLDKKPTVILTPVGNNPCLSLAVLNDEQRTNWIDQATDHPLKQQIINIINSTVYDKSLLPQLADKVKLEDTTSKIKFADIFPNWDLNG
jgi:MoaA/NifB/PqqE/SkfB family radical SAM enzyme